MKVGIGKDERGKEEVLTKNRIDEVAKYARTQKLRQLSCVFLREFRRKII